MRSSLHPRPSRRWKVNGWRTPRNEAPCRHDLTFQSSGRVSVAGMDERRVARSLGRSFAFTARVVAGDVALLEWTASTSSGARVQDPVDAFVIRGGRIPAYTIHYPSCRRRARPGEQRRVRRHYGGTDHG